MNAPSTASPPQTAAQNINVEAIQRLETQRQSLLDQLAQVIVGQREAIDHVLLTIFCGGHALIVGVPGLAVAEK
jgi:MoxR-like ATPase